MFWVPDPSAHPPLDLVLALNVLLESDHSSAFLAPSLNPSLHRFCPPPPRIPAAEPGPVPTGLPQSPCLRSLGYSEAQRQGWSGCPESSDCPWRRRKTRWSCSWWAFQRSPERSPCWGWSRSACDVRPSCGGSGQGCRWNSGQIQSPGLQEEVAEHRAGSCNRLKNETQKHGLMLIDVWLKGLFWHCGKNTHAQHWAFFNRTNIITQWGCCGVCHTHIHSPVKKVYSSIAHQDSLSWNNHYKSCKIQIWKSLNWSVLCLISQLKWTFLLTIPPRPKTVLCYRWWSSETKKKQTCLSQQQYLSTYSQLSQNELFFVSHKLHDSF